MRLQDYTQNAQAILINPKWRECDHFKEFLRGIQGTQDTTMPKTQNSNSEAGEEESDNEDTNMG